MFKVNNKNTIKKHVIDVIDGKLVSISSNVIWFSENQSK